MWITTLRTEITDKYKIHQQVFSLFSDEIAKIGRNFCYRFENGNIKICSFSKVNNESVEINFYKGDILKGATYCSPGKGTYRDENGKRHRMTPRKDIQDVFLWFERRMSNSALCKSLSGRMLSPESIKKPSGKKMVYSRWVLNYELEILQPKTFEEIIISGVGQGSGFGLGLLELS